MKVLYKLEKDNILTAYIGGEPHSFGGFEEFEIPEAISLHFSGVKDALELFTDIKATLHTENIPGVYSVNDIYDKGFDFACSDDFSYYIKQEIEAKYGVELDKTETLRISEAAIIEEGVHVIDFVEDAIIYSIPEADKAYRRIKNA